MSQLSPDGRWWWDGAQWVPAISPDGLWRWNGFEWVPAAPRVAAPRGGGGGAAAVAIILGFLGILVLVSLLVTVILLTMGNQISNVFSNVVNALSA